MSKNYTMYKLSPAKNGYILEKKDVWDGVAEETETLVGTDGEPEHDTFVAFLWDILEHYGPSDSKYSPKRIHARIEPGADTDGMSQDEEWFAQCLVDEKQDTETWAEYGERIHKDLSERVKLSQQFKKDNDYR